MGLCPTMEPSTPFVQRPSFACRINQLPARKNWPCFLKALFATPADLVPNDTELLVRFHSMAQPRLNRALRALCEAATDERHLYPGTSLRMVFEGPSCLIEN